jgi:homoserine dehydrogenase
VRHLSVALVGFGSVGRAFARLLLETDDRLRARHGLECTVTGVATRRHGVAIDRLGLDLATLLSIEPDGSLAELHCCPHAEDTVGFIREAAADVVIEATVLDVETGGAAVEHIRSAFAAGAHVVTANKGPIACAYRDLRALATASRRQFRFEGTVMDGAPVFNLVAETLPGCEVVGFSGVLNSTTNLLLTRMEQGASLDEALADARGRGIVEANPDHDIDGHDAAAKAAALVNVLMDGTVTPRDIPTIGIRRVTRDALDAEVQRGRRLRLVARAARRGDEIAVRVGPEALPEADALARLGGTSNALTLRTDLMGELTIVEHDPGIEQTAYALLSDLIAVGRAIGVRA